MLRKLKNFEFEENFTTFIVVVVVVVAVNLEGIT